MGISLHIKRHLKIHCWCLMACGEWLDDLFPDYGRKFYRFIKHFTTVLNGFTQIAWICCLDAWKKFKQIFSNGGEKRWFTIRESKQIHFPKNLQWKGWFEPAFFLFFSQSLNIFVPGCHLRTKIRWEKRKSCKKNQCDRSSSSSKPPVGAPADSILPQEKKSKTDSPVLFFPSPRLLLNHYTVKTV